jgi:hypothetical protein
LARTHEQAVPEGEFVKKRGPRKNGRRKTQTRFQRAPFKFEKHGQSGLEISEVLPYLSQHADNLCFIRSMQTDSANHSNASLCLHTGSANFVRPSVGSWVLYGFDLSDEPQSVLQMYGADNEPTAEYARQCTLARRFAEAEVRFIQVNTPQTTG